MCAGHFGLLIGLKLSLHIPLTAGDADGQGVGPSWHIHYMVIGEPGEVQLSFLERRIGGGCQTIAAFREFIE